MSPEQRSALEAVVGRPLTIEDVAAVDPMLLDPRNDIAIAARLSVGRTRIVDRRISELTVLDALGPVAGNSFLFALESIQTADDLPEPLQPLLGAIKRGVGWLKTTDGLNVGSLVVREMLDQLAAAGTIEAGYAHTLKGIAVIADPVSVDAVSDALNGVAGHG